jgi:hypothetical protein
MHVGDGQIKLVSTQLSPVSRQNKTHKRVESAMQDCRTDCGCKAGKQENGLDIPDTPCAWPVHATAQHHTVISTALPVFLSASLPTLAAWKGDGLDMLGWVVVWWFLGGSLAPFHHASPHSLTPRAWFWFRPQVLGLSVQQGR